ncbi:McrB family protein [Bacillus sp. FJAT-29937]|uniref:McrB family protein n=1 Tax=Bacillus sp. FJAT-29937 TaxID=1720553 RepID=UPI00082D09E6|nr:AAA family ATPase [Bacillus sp. FJAT-29937]
MIKEVRSWSKPQVSNLIARKKVDWSIFEYGTQIPFEFHQDFAIANANHYLNIGEKVSIELIINEQIYKVNLINFKRKDSNTGSLQLRYDQNSSLKELLKGVFDTSYQYLSENREEKSKKPVHTPEEMSEYIDFYQTENPFIYKVKLLSKQKQLSRPSFWWVNQGQTYKQEKSGSYLWAPQKSKQGIPLPHHVRLLEPVIGDIVFCYSARELRSIGVVKNTAVKAPKPIAITSDAWQEDGYLLALSYFQLEPTIRKEEIPEEWRLKESGPFDVNGDLKQGYFFGLTEEFAKNLYKLFNYRFPSEVRLKLEEYETSKEQKNIKEIPQTYLSNKKLIDHIYGYIRSKGFFFKKEEVINLFLSLKTKPFVILSGISGTGKTKMVQWFAESLGATEENGQFALIPIRPDWNDGSDLLGYVDIKGEFREGPLTKVIKRALDHPKLPHFVLLDEMNLARVEYYFSDILSVMESRKWKEGKIVSTYLLTEETAGVNLKLPNNLYVIGTVNMDETTHPFSKKVLDRANTIEFNRVDLGNLTFLHELEQVEPVVVGQASLAAKYLHLKDVYRQKQDLVERVTLELVKMNELLQLINAHFGYRVRDEICFYMAYAEENDLMKFDEALDHCILQKILPRISGSDSRVDELLRKLFQLFTNKQYEDSVDIADLDLSGTTLYPQSTKKVAEMLRRLEDGFTSFWIS